MKKTNKYVSLSLIVITAFLLSVISISATATLNSPANNAVVSDTVNFNVTVNDNSASIGTQLINLSFYAKSASTANSSWSLIGTNNSLNMSGYGNITITTIDLTTALEDSNDYIFNVTAVNDTGGGFVGDDTNTGITIDNTEPATPSSLTPTSDTDGSVTFSGTVTGSQTTSCTLYFNGINPGSSSYTMTHTGNSCSYTHSSVPEQSYNWYIRASDSSNTTDSSTQTTNVDISTGAGNIVNLIQQQQQDSLTTTTTASLTDSEEESIFKKPVFWIFISIVIVVLIVLYNRR